MGIIRWIPLLSFIVATILRVIGDHKEAQRFGPFTIASLVFYFIGFAICLAFVIGVLI